MSYIGCTDHFAQCGQIYYRILFDAETAGHTGSTKEIYICDDCLFKKEYAEALMYLYHPYSRVSVFFVGPLHWIQLLEHDPLAPVPTRVTAFGERLGYTREDYLNHDKPKPTLEDIARLGLVP